MMESTSNSPDKKRFVFRLSVPTVKLLKAYCQGRLHGQQSRTIRKAMAAFNELHTLPVSPRTWKLNSSRGAQTVSVWAPVELVEKAMKNAEQHNMSLNSYVEASIRSMLSVTGR